MQQSPSSTDRQHPAFTDLFIGRIEFQGSGSYRPVPLPRSRIPHALPRSPRADAGTPRICSGCLHQRRRRAQAGRQGRRPLRRGRQREGLRQGPPPRRGVGVRARSAAAGRRTQVQGPADVRGDGLRLHRQEAGRRRGDAGRRLRRGHGRQRERRLVLPHALRPQEREDPRGRHGGLEGEGRRGRRRQGQGPRGEDLQGRGAVADDRLARRRRGGGEGSQQGAAARLAPQARGVHRQGAAGRRAEPGQGDHRRARRLHSRRGLLSVDQVRRQQGRGGRQAHAQGRQGHSEAAREAEEEWLRRRPSPSSPTATSAWAAAASSTSRCSRRGTPTSKVYVGGWSEWGNTPELPLGTQN